MIVFYVAAAIAIFSTAMVITRRHAVHALLYFIVSLFSLSVIFFELQAPLAAALEVIIYAGAIMVLFIFVIMLLNLGPSHRSPEDEAPRPQMWIGPAILSLILIAEVIYMAARGKSITPVREAIVTPKQVGIALYGTYLLAVELTSMLLLAGLVGAYHLGRRSRAEEGGSDE